MTPKQILRAALINAPELARLSGVSLSAIRAIMRPEGNKAAREPRPATRRKLAAALRKHSRTLDTLADSLDPPA